MSAEGDVTQPLRNAVVEVQGGNLAEPLGVRTDAEGIFQLLNLQPGSFRLRVSKASFVPVEYGQDGPGRPGVPIVLTAGENVNGLTVVLRRGGLIAGRVVDESGAPVRGAPVVLMQYRTFGGERRLAAMPGPWSVTDQLGEYRISGILTGDYVLGAYPPGEYRFIAPGQMPAPDGETRVVTQAEFAWAERQLGTLRPGTNVFGAASQDSPPPPGRRIVRVPIFYPNVLDPAEAAFLSIKEAEQRFGTDFVMRAAAAARIQGCVVGPDGQPVTDAVLTVGGATIGLKDCAFTIDNLLPGRHMLVARSRDAELVASEEIQLTGDDILDLQLQLRPAAASVTGRILLSLSSQPPPPDLAHIRVRLLRLRPSLATVSAVTDAAGLFAIPKLGEGQYQLDTTLGTSEVARFGPWMVDEVLANGQNVTEGAIDVRPGTSVELSITLTDRPTQLSGLLHVGEHTASGYYIIVFPVEPERRQVGSRRFPPPVRTRPDGTFDVAGLPLGSYLVAALSAVTNDQLQDSAFVQTLAAHAVTVLFEDASRKQRVALRLK